MHSSIKHTLTLCTKSAYSQTTVQYSAHSQTTVHTHKLQYTLKKCTLKRADFKCDTKLFPSASRTCPLVTKNISRLFPPYCNANKARTHTHTHKSTYTRTHTHTHTHAHAHTRTRTHCAATLKPGRSTRLCALNESTPRDSRHPH